jgi:non-canonical purine NTP pyrophosphatase (RdgB/HAM1 family)
MREVRFASANPIKLEEAAAIIPAIAPIELDVPEIQSPDPVVVVRDKLASAAGLATDGPVIVEDTGLAFDAWQGLPGALVKWFVERLGPERLARMCLAEDRAGGAEAVSAIGVVDDGEVRVWTGRVRGRIVPPRGDLGGWTPIFEPDGYGKTLAEMTFAERMAATMRRQPLEQARDWLEGRARR